VTRPRPLRTARACLQLLRTAPAFPEPPRTAPARLEPPRTAYLPYHQNFRHPWHHAHLAGEAVHPCRLAPVCVWYGGERCD